jgi:hypothetical protein
MRYDSYSSVPHLLVRLEKAHKTDKKEFFRKYTKRLPGGGIVDICCC